MTILSDFRAKYPQYDDMSDVDLATALHKKFYADIPEDQFAAKIGLDTGPQASPNSIGPAAVAQQAPGFAESAAGSPAGYVANDIAQSGLAGMRSGAESTAGALGSANELTGRAAGWAADKLGAPPGVSDAVRTVGRYANPITGLMPTTKEVAAGTDAAVSAMPGGDAIQSVTRHEPQTVPGEYARTGGEFLVNAVGGPGGLLRKTAAVVVPAALSETAGQLTKGTALEPYARMAGGLAGGAASALKSGAPAAVRQTAEDIKALGQKAYDASEAAGVLIKPQGLKVLAAKVMTDLAKKGYHDRNQPGIYGGLDVLRNAVKSGMHMTLKGLDTLRQTVSGGYIKGNDKNNAMVSDFIGAIDKLIASNHPGVMAGLNTKAGTSAILQARKYWHQARKMETVEKFAKRGDAIGNSQINQDVEGATRRQVRTLLTDEAKARGFTPAELKAAKQAASMTAGMRTLHAASGMLPQGKLGGMIQMATATAHGFNPALLAVQGAGMLVGGGAKMAEAALSRRAFNKFADTVARGGTPAAGRSLADVAKTAAGPAARSATLGGLHDTGKREPLSITVHRQPPWLKRVVRNHLSEADQP